MIKADELKIKRGLKENLLESKIDKELLTTGLIYNGKIEVIIIGEFSKELRDAVASKYEKEGNYSKVEHSTSSENGERPGLTNFTFFF